MIKGPKLVEMYTKCPKQNAMEVVNGISRQALELFRVLAILRKMCHPQWSLNLYTLLTETN